MKEKSLQKVSIRETGFTLIELLITVAMVAVVLAIGIPSFKSTIERNQLATMANEFMSALNIARSEAVKRGTAVAVCTSSDGVNCAGAAGYERGWIIFVDNVVTNGTRENTEELLKRSYALGGGYTLRGSLANGINNFVRFQSSGQSSATGTGTFNLCKDNDSTKSRSIVIEYTGRTHVEKSAAGCT